MEKFGLIGRTLKHSYSEKIHAILAGYEYKLYELEPDQLKSFVKSGKLKGFNVTIPYKKDVMEYLDEIDDSARLIGAVNTVVNENGKLKGYNTDFKGVEYMLLRAGITLKNKKVMILGTGGTGNTVTAVAKAHGAKEIIIVSRGGKINYDNYFERADVDVIVNTTPVGMYPNNYQSPIDLQKFDNLSGVVDVIYNPDTTLLTAQAKQQGIKNTNGLPMLVAQAKFAMEKFVGQSVSDSVIESALNKLWADTLNIVLIGMPGSGKSTVGRALADVLGREFIDTDKEIEKRENCDIPTIFRERGEEYFRKVESEVLKDVGKLTGKVIATGGGIVKNTDNYFPLKCNGKIFWLNRDIEALATDNRPLSKDIQTVKKLYEERKDKYMAFSDFIIDNNCTVQSAVKGVLENL